MAEVALLEVLQVSLVDAPVVPSAVLTAVHLHEAVVHGQVVPNAVLPAWAPVPEVGKALLHGAVDGCQVEFLGGRVQDDFGDQGNVGEGGRW